MNKSQIVVDISTSYMTRDDDYTTTANIAYLPNPTKYYILGLTSRKNYSELNPKDESKIYINAEIGKRYDNILLRGGIIESTGGVGVDYFTHKDKVKLTAEVYDFNSENDIRGDNPHLNLKATYLYLKHLQFIAGIDNILNVDAREFFLGVGVKFKDNDLKPLLSGGASSFLK
jgi:phospholipid/cholesterol/gamma-HCH transport system substrate-binding protein